MIQNAQNPQKKTIRDARGRWLTLQTLLGRGSFGKVYRAEDESSGEVLAAKLPLTAEDLSGEAPPPEVLELFSRLVRDEAGQLKKMPGPLVPESFGLVDAGGATPCLLETYLEDSLLSRLHNGMNFAELCGALALVCEALAPLHESGRAHGNLKPGNIFFEPAPDGSARVRLTGPLTTEYLKHLLALNARHPGLTGWLPPELLTGDAPAALPAWTDTFTLGKILFEAVVQPSSIASWATRGGPFTGGIDKTTANRFRGALSQRLLESNSNPHVRDLLIRRATALLNRALSVETSPSPPYRFHSASEMAARLIELQELFHPGFAQIGQPLLEPDKSSATFREDEEVRFTLSFRCQGGIEDVDLITCMTYVRDLEADQKVRDAGIEVLPNHDGHRFRFAFRIPRLYPGRFLVRVALAVKGSPGKPTPRDLTFDVLPKEGARPAEPEVRTEERPGQREPKIPMAPAAPPRATVKPVRDEIPETLQPAPDEHRGGERPTLRSLGEERPGGGRSEPPKLKAVEKGQASARGDSSPSGLRSETSLTGSARAAGDLGRDRRQPAGGSASSPRDEGGRRDEFLGYRDTPRPGRDLVWVAEEERSGPGDTGRDLEPLSSRPSIDPWDMDDRPAKRPGEPVDLDEVPARARGLEERPARKRGEGPDQGDRPAKRPLEPRGGDAVPAKARGLEERAGRPRDELPDMDDRPAKLRIEPRDQEESSVRAKAVPDARGGRGRPSDETAELIHEEGSGSSQSSRARIEAAPVGRDAAVRPVSKDAAPSEPRREREAPRRHLTPVVGPAADRAHLGASSSAGRGSERAERERAGASDAASRRPERPAPREPERPTRADERPARGSTPSSGKPGEQFIPELYYKEAREKPMPGEEDDEFFRRGAIRLRREDFIIIGLGLVLLLLIAAIVWVVI